MPVSISLGLWTTLLIYLVSIPLGIAQGGARRLALRRLRPRASLIVLNAIPAFLFALLLVVLFAGGSYLKWFPLRGLVSDELDAASAPVAQGARLFLAHGAADHRHDDRRLRRRSPS